MLRVCIATLTFVWGQLSVVCDVALTRGGFAGAFGQRAGMDSRGEMRFGKAARGASAGVGQRVIRKRGRGVCGAGRHADARA
jgi:hypothetical protein